jgi:Mg2+ and Co2+ transporter CorA
MEKDTLKRLGAQLRKEIVPLEDLPFPMREALRKLAEKYDGQQTSHADNDNTGRVSDDGGPCHSSCSALSKR